MGRMFFNSFRKCLNISLAITASFALLPTGASAWGGNGQRVVVNQAIETLPADLRAYFENNRSFLVQHVTDPLDAEAKNRPIGITASSAWTSTDASLLTLCLAAIKSP